MDGFQKNVAHGDRWQVGFDPTLDLEPQPTKCVAWTRSVSLTGVYEKFRTLGPTLEP